MTITAIIIGVGITGICLQVTNWLVERRPENNWYREVEPTNDAEPMDDIKPSYPKLSLLDHDDYEVIAGCVEYETYVDKKGNVYRKPLRRPIRIILKRGFHLTDDAYIVSMPLDNLVVKAYRTPNARELIGYENI